MCYFFYSWTFFLWIFPCSNIVPCQSFIWCIKLPSPSLMQWITMPRCTTSSYIYCNNTTMMWCGLWVEPHLLWLRWWFLILCHPFEQTLSAWGWMNNDTFHIGGGIIRCHKHAHVNNPWFFRVIIIGLFIIRFIVTNL